MPLMSNVRKIMYLPSLENIGGNLNASGSQDLDIPKLRSVGGDFIVDGTQLAHLPPNLEHIGGNVFISSAEPNSLLQDLIRAKENGILKGHIFVDGSAYTPKSKPFWKFW